MKAVFLQVSHKAVSPVNPVIEYYHERWPEAGLHVASEHYLELPTWVAEVARYLNPSLWRQEFRVLVDSPKVEGARLYDQASAGRVYFGSVLDINKNYWHELITSAGRWSGTFILGGYVNKDEFTEYDNVIWLDDPKELLFWFPGMTVEGLDPDYSLFAGTWCVPRLQLSKGCLYNCAFCTVEREVTTLSKSDILAQVRSWEGLKFSYVYLDDKTFGQASNWRLVDLVYMLIKRYNPGFQGFIVQTTAHEVIEHAEEWVRDYHIRFIEVGVETLDADTLKLWRKPHGVKHINLAADVIADLIGEGDPVWLIPNIIFGIEDHDYTQTLEWLEHNAYIIAFINPYLLCQYHDSKGTVASKTGEAGGDADETSWDKSWLSKDDVLAASAAMDRALEV